MTAAPDAPMTRGEALAWTWKVTACFALLGGVLESVIRAAQPWAPPHRIHIGGWLWWMPAVANLVWFVPVGCAMTLLLVLRPRWLTPGRIVIGIAWLGFLNGLVLLSPPLHRAAVWVLAAGLAVAAGRLVDARPRRMRPLVEWTALALSLFTLGTAIGVEAWRARIERAQLATATPRPGAPNVLLLVLDNVRARSLTTYGYFRRTTPVLEAWSARAVVFDRAYSTSSWSLPSHASLMTGRWAHELEASWRVPLGATHPTLAETFGHQGYATAGFVANGAYTQRETGLHRGFGRYEDYQFSVGQVLMASRLGLLIMNGLHRRFGVLEGPWNDIWHRKPARVLHEQLLSWIDGTKGRPFFAFVNYFDAHMPYYAPPDLSPGFPPVPPAGAMAATDTTRPFKPEEHIDGYDAAILGMDRELGRLFAALGERGLDRNTIIVVTSDHGEEFDEHNYFGHGLTGYGPVLHIPLMIRYADQLEARRVSEPVSLRDVGASVLDLAGVASHALQGCSLRGMWTAGRSGTPTQYVLVRRGINTPPEFPASRGDVFGEIDGPWHRILNHGDGRVEVFDMLRDPWEQRDRARDPELGPMVDAFRARAAAPPPSAACVSP